MRRFASTGLSWLLLGSLLCATSVASAQTSERAALAAARDHMERGQELYGAGRYLEAAQEFIAAYEARDFSAFLFNAGVAYEQYGDAHRAIDFYERYLDREPNAPDAAEIRSKVAALRAALAAAGEPATPAEPTPPEGEAATPPEGAETAPETPAAAETPPAEAPPTPVHVEGPVESMKSLLSIQTEPAGAQISVRRDGEVVASGPAPFAHTLDEGEYQVVVEHPDYRAVQQELRVRPGKVYVVIVEMSQGQFLGYLQVRSDPPGAAVYIDDRSAGSAGQTPFQNPLPTGEHHIWLERPGYQPEERTVEVGLGEQLAVDVSLTRVTFGRVRVVANVPSAVVYVDGERAGSIPYEGEVPAGEHEIRISARGMKDWVEDVDVPRGQLTPIRVRLRPAVSRGGAWAALTIAAVTGGGGLALAILSDHLEDDLRADRAVGVLASDDPRITRGRWYTISADAAFGLAGLTGILSLYYFLRDPLPDSEGRVLAPRDWAFLPSIDPLGGSAGLSVRRRF